MYVSVFYREDASEGYRAGRAYTYETDLPLKPLDKVIAPTAKNPEQRAMVVDIDLPEPPFPCKKVEKMDMGDNTADE